MVHPEKASQPWCQGCEPRLSSGSCWCSGLWPTAELWPLQWCSQPVGNTHARSSLTTPPGRSQWQGLGLLWSTPGCPAPDWGSGTGPGCQALPWWTSLGSSRGCALAWVSTCSPSNIQLPVAQHNCNSRYKPGYWSLLGFTVIALNVMPLKLGLSPVKSLPELEVMSYLKSPIPHLQSWYSSQLGCFCTDKYLQWAQHTWCRGCHSATQLTDVPPWGYSTAAAPQSHPTTQAGTSDHPPWWSTPAGSIHRMIRPAPDTTCDPQIGSY